MIYTPDRKINPDSFYEREETIELLYCASCEDEILEGKEVYVKGVCYCGYCKEHVLKIKK